MVLNCASGEDKQRIACAYPFWFLIFECDVTHCFKLPLLLWAEVNPFSLQLSFFFFFFAPQQERHEASKKYRYLVFLFWSSHPLTKNQSPQHLSMASPFCCFLLHCCGCNSIMSWSQLPFLWVWVALSKTSIASELEQLFHSKCWTYQ